MTGSGEESADEAVTKMFAANEATRRELREAALDRLTPHERDLVREAVVAAFVSSARYFGASYDNEIPKDSKMMDAALDTINAYPDLYPALSGYQKESDTEDSK